MAGVGGGSAPSRRKARSNARNSRQSAFISELCHRMKARISLRFRLNSTENCPCRQFAFRERSRPSEVRGPVDLPPWRRQRVYAPVFLFLIAGAPHGFPFRVLAPQRGAVAGSPDGLPFLNFPREGLPALHCNSMVCSLSMGSILVFCIFSRSSQGCVQDETIQRGVLGGVTIKPEKQVQRRSLNMSRRCLLLMVAITRLCSVLFAADFGDGVKAFNTGDYATAMAIWKTLADQGNADAQFRIGQLYQFGNGVEENRDEAVKWYKAAAEKGQAEACMLLASYYSSRYVSNPDGGEAVRLYRIAFEKGIVGAAPAIASLYIEGRGVIQSVPEALNWYRRGAERGDIASQIRLGEVFGAGQWVKRDLIQAHAWFNLAAAGGSDLGRHRRDALATSMTGAQVLAAQELARAMEIRKKSPIEAPPKTSLSAPTVTTRERMPPGTSETLVSTGSGFLVNGNGDALTNRHVVAGCTSIRVQLGNAAFPASVVGSDSADDLAVVHSRAPISSFAIFRDVAPRIGEGVVAAGFPLRGILASSLNITSGNVSALAGMGDDQRIIQITAPIQPGNSGGPVLDGSGNVAGVVVGKLDSLKLSRMIHDIPQNVNFAINEEVAKQFLERERIQYIARQSVFNLDTAEIADEAGRFTAVIECWK